MNLILVIFLALIPFDIFSEESKDDYDEIIQMWTNFYNETYDNIDVSRKSTFRLSLETWLSQEAIDNFINNKDSTKTFKEITNYCNKNFWTEQRWSCEDMIRNKISTEKIIFDFEKTLKNETYWNEIYADWDLSNSFFDIIHDLNIIDIILFWEDATIFFFKYDKDNKNTDNPYRPTINKSWELEDNNLLQWLDSQNDYSWTLWDEEWNIWNDNLIPLNSNDILNSSWTNTKVNIINDNGNICRDPLKLTFTQNSNKNIFWNNNGSESSWEIPETEESDLIHNNWIPDELFNEIIWWDINSIQNNSAIFKPNLNLSINKQKTEKVCKKELYWWLICLDDLKNNWWCTKDKVFCVEINYKTANHKTSWEWEDNSCIACIVKSIIKMIDKELMWRALYPRENSNKNWSVPNWLWIFGNPSKFISVEWLPLPWLSEKSGEKLSLEKMEEEREHSKDYNSNITNCESRCLVKQQWWQQTSDAITCNEECYESLNVIKDVWNKSLSKEKNVNSQKGYFSDVNWRLNEFRELFERWIEDQIRAFPFFEWENIKQCNQIR